MGPLDNVAVAGANGGGEGMTEAQAKVGAKIVTLETYNGVPVGTYGIIDEDYGSGVMVAWDLPEHPLPPGYRQHDGTWAVRSRLLRDGFDKATELENLALIGG